MKINDLRKLSDKELNDKIIETKRELNAGGNDNGRN